MKVLFITNYPSPYRVDFFNLLGQQCDLSVCFLNTPEEQKHRSDKWFNTDYSGFKAIFLNKETNMLGVKPDIKDVLKNVFDYIIFGGYSSPTQMYAMEYLRYRKIPYYIEADGGLIKHDSFIKKLIKKHFVSSASGYIGSGVNTRDYFVYYGANEKAVYDYNFTSQKSKDLIEAYSFLDDDKKLLKDILSFNDSYNVITVIDSSVQQVLSAINQISHCISQNYNFWVLLRNTDIDESIVNANKNIKIIRVNDDNEIAKYLVASDLFLSFVFSDVNNFVMLANVFCLPVVSVADYVNVSFGIQQESEGYNSVANRIINVLEDRKLFEELANIGRTRLNNIICSSENSDSETNCIELLRNTIRYVARKKLGLNNDQMVITVGQFIHRKGFDILLRASSDIDADIYFIGGKPDDSYKSYQSDNVVFIDFLTKCELRDYYRAADVFAMPTREDIWGLVVNEALSFGLPVVSSDKCVAGLELINPGQNGYIVPVEDSQALAISINKAMSLKAIDSYKCICNYSLENMVTRHIQIFEDIKRDTNG